MEVVQGMRDGNELRLLRKYFRKRQVDIVQIDKNISARAMFLVEDYYLSHSLGVCDAIIASTALENMETLLTGNDKHYRMIPNIQIQKFRP
jgi:predicted nucleic acid-binding protein